MRLQHRSSIFLKWLHVCVKIQNNKVKNIVYFSPRVFPYFLIDSLLLMCTTKSSVVWCITLSYNQSKNPNVMDIIHIKFTLSSSLSPKISFRFRLPLLYVCKLRPHERKPLTLVEFCFFLKQRGRLIRGKDNKNKDTINDQTYDVLLHTYCLF